MACCALAKSILAARGVRKPIWNTEINYGLTGRGTRARRLSAGRQAAFVSRTYILNAAARVSRVYWYGWDVHRIASVDAHRPQRPLADAGRSGLQHDRQVARRRPAARLHDPQRHHDVHGGGVGSRVRRIYWNTSRTVTVRRSAVGDVADERDRWGHPHAWRHAGARRQRAGDDSLEQLGRDLGARDVSVTSPSRSPAGEQVAALAGVLGGRIRLPVQPRQDREPG